VPCGWWTLFSLLKDRKENRQEVVNNYYVKDDHSVEIRDSVLLRSKVGDSLKVCPYCGKRLEIADEPNFCPYCTQRIRQK